MYGRLNSVPEVVPGRDGVINVGVQAGEAVLRVAVRGVAIQITVPLNENTHRTALGQDKTRTKWNHL